VVVVQNDRGASLDGVVGRVVVVGVRKGMSRTTIKAVGASFPNRGFHATLLRLAKDYGGSTLVGGWKVTRGIVKLLAAPSSAGPVGVVVLRFPGLSWLALQ